MVFGVGVLLFFFESKVVGVSLKEKRVGISKAFSSSKQNVYRRSSVTKARIAYYYFLRRTKAHMCAVYCLYLLC